jgi:stage II sporulation protein D
MTEDAESVWGYPIPYLVSVSSEFDTGANGYASEKRVSISDFKETLEDNYDCDFSSNDTLITNINRSGAGGIISVTLGGKTISGTAFRTLFGLRSSNVVINVNDTEVTFSVKGYGHGVGMSQYGANQLAKQGYTYDEILKHYYSGTELSKICVFNSI